MAAAATAARSAPPSEASSYRRVAKHSQIDESLFGSKGSASRMAGAAATRPGKVTASPASTAVALTRAELDRMRGRPTVLSAAEVQALHEEEARAKEQQRAVANERKARMLAMEQANRSQVGGRRAPVRALQTRTRAHTLAHTGTARGPEHAGHAHGDGAAQGGRRQGCPDARRADRARAAGRRKGDESDGAVQQVRRAMHAYAKARASSRDRRPGMCTAQPTTIRLLAIASMRQYVALTATGASQSATRS